MKNKIVRLYKRMKNSEFNLFILVIIPTLIILIYNAFQNINIGYLQIHSIDEYVFHGSLLHMYDSLISHKISGLFGFGFYQYGFIYFILNLIVSLPGFIQHNTSLTIITPRIITSLFATGSLILIYRFSRLYINKTPSVLFTLFFVTLPAFWYNATWFHPDWSMTFFLIGFIYFLAKDNWQFKRNFYTSVVFYGLAVAFKYQAITMIPLLGLYIFYDAVAYLSFKNILIKARHFLVSIFIVIGVFIFANPYILHPLGWQAFSGSFVANMDSNATNHGSLNDVTIIDKVNLAVGEYYFNIIFLFILIIAALWLVGKFFKKRESSIFSILAINFLVNISYLFLFVNKAWQIYYLPVIVTGLLITIHFIRKLPTDKQVWFLSVAIIIQGISFNTKYITIMTGPRDSIAPDYISYDTQTQIYMNRFIIKNLKTVSEKNSVVLLSPYTPFTYEDIGLEYENVKIIFGPLSKESFDLEEYLVGQRRYWGNLKQDAELATSFKPVDYIVLRKDIPFIDKVKLNNIRNKSAYLNANTIVNELYSGTYNYDLLAENDTVVIFKKVNK